MIGSYIEAFRREHKLSQAALSKRLREAGWPLTQSKLSALERDAARGVSHQLSTEQVEAICRATGEPRWLVFFHSGLIPPELSETSPLSPDCLGYEQIQVAMALLYAALGKGELGPPVTPEVAVEAGLWPRPQTIDDKARMERELTARGAAPLGPDAVAMARLAGNALPPRPATARPKQPASTDLLDLYK